MVPEVREFCREHHIRRLALFGSALMGDLKEDSDIDLLVEFHPGHVPGYISLARMESLLSAIIGYRKVDLRTAGDLSRYFRNDVLERSVVIYAET